MSVSCASGYGLFESSGLSPPNHSELAYNADSVTQSDNDFGNDVGCGTVTFVYYYVCLVFLTEDFNLSVLGSNSCQLKLPANIHDHKNFFWVSFVIPA